MKELALHLLDIVKNSTAAGATLVEVCLTEDEAQTLTIVIRDNGRGMSPDFLAAVSDPFTTTRTTRKMGLGIPLLRMSAELTGGSLSIASTLGAGTRLQAVFDGGHIDCPPLGDLPGTISLLIQGAPDLRLVYTHRRDGQAVTLDTQDLRDQLGGGISLAEPEVVLWIREYLEEQEGTLKPSVS